ncbi:enoyl-ACP reductase FabV [Kosakonia sacchari]|uniref:enoyl-ACP reductase FabV n=1 Tax=Kosakonia sacchari TaxID=1158459 RepID=UPI0013627656|nr:enoyl-ACP reductase FabV [Kosakonia sacchari]QHM95100.1 trans-2-enoyl-CoA reductase family protein [Kosakonia sacchari]
MELIIQGNVAKNCHTEGLRQGIDKQINYVESHGEIYGPRKVLVIGASSGYGLASRIAVAFGGGADTIGVSFEKSPGEKGIGSAGWYNNIFFRRRAHEKGLIAKNFIADAFSDTTRNDVIAYIKQEFGGNIDLLVYSVASGVRICPDGTRYTSTLGVRGQAFSGPGFDLETRKMVNQTLEPVTEQQLADTVKVMGGEDWQRWIDMLSAAGVLAEGFKTVAYSYTGPKSTWPLYKEGALGAAKAHLHATADQLDAQLQRINGHAYAVVCKALVTKASAFIPMFPLYITLLYKVMKQKRLHETCIEQMHRLMLNHLYPPMGNVVTDEERRIRLDDFELRPDVQQAVELLRKRVTTENFKTVGDFAGYLAEFYALNGFSMPDVDYSSELDLRQLVKEYSHA